MLDSYIENQDENQMDATISHEVPQFPTKDPRFDEEAENSDQFLVLDTESLALQADMPSYLPSLPPPHTYKHDDS